MTRTFGLPLALTGTLLLATGARAAFVPCSTSSSSSTAPFALFAAKPKVFIDGEAGTTGLQVRERLASRDDLEILSIPDDLRKDDATRKKLINEADAVILCTLLLAVLQLLCLV